LKTLDVITLGETMIRLSPQHFERLERATVLDCHIGGSESNLAIALTRLGLRTAWISKLVDNPLGRKIARTLAAHGVETSYILWSVQGRVGVYFIEFGAEPRPTRVLYDRKDSAASTLSPEEIDWSCLEKARHLHLTGITPALSDSCRQTVGRALLEARQRGLTASFDVNYRTKLWEPPIARECLETLIPGVNVLFCPLEDAKILFQLTGSEEEIAKRLSKRFNINIVCLTLGGNGALAYDGSFHRRPVFQAETVDRVGAGDAFDAGFLYGFLQGDVPLGMDFGSAMASLKHTIPGDEFVSSRQEVEELLAREHRDIQR